VVGKPEGNEFLELLDLEQMTVVLSSNYYLGDRTGDEQEQSHPMLSEKRVEEFDTLQSYFHTIGSHTGIDACFGLLE